MRSSSLLTVVAAQLLAAGCASSPSSPRTETTADAGLQAGPAAPMPAVRTDAARAMPPAPEDAAAPEGPGPADRPDAAPPLADTAPSQADGNDPTPRPDGGTSIASALTARGELVAELGAFPEGPGWREDGSVYVCARSLVRVAPDGKRFRVLSSFECLGTVVLADRSVLITGAAGLYQLLPDGKVALLADAPGANDLTIDRAGTVFFTAGGRIMRLEPAGALDPVATIAAANGIELDPEDRFVYVSRTSMDQVVRFEKPAPGQPAAAPTVVLGGIPKPDGLAFDAAGNLWAALHEARQVGIYDPRARKELGRIAVPVMYSIQNLAFGGPEHDRLFVAGGRFGSNAHLIRFAVGLRGHRLNRGAAAYKPLRMLPEVATERTY